MDLNKAWMNSDAKKLKEIGRTGLKRLVEIHTKYPPERNEKQNPTVE
jgi:hypothetical protein